MNTPTHLSDSDMSDSPGSTSRVPANLALLAHETRLLLRTAAALDDEAVKGPTLCVGWTRAHVLSHIARNADALGNLVEWAVTGTPKAMYASPESRDADIAAGSTRGAQELFTDLEDSAARFALAAAGLAGAPAQVEVEMRGGRKVLGHQLPTLRLMEVVIHHVDLDAGYTFADADPGFVTRAISNAVARISAKDDVPSVALSSTEGDQWTMGEGSHEVTGTNAGLLLWLTRGSSSGVTSSTPVPTLPAWG